jgi:DnaJ-like protein
MAFNDAQYGDIRATLAVSHDEAQSGSRRVINLPDGRAVTVMVPAGVQNGTELRLSGQGETSGPGGKAGDLILRVSVIATANRFEDQRWADSAMPTTAMQQPFSSSATQPPTEYAAGGAGYPPAAAYYPNVPPTEAMDRNYPYQTVPAAPQSYPSYEAYPQPQPQQIFAAWDTAQPPRPKRSGLVTFLVILIVLVLLVGGGSVYYIGYYQPNQVQSAANATAQVQATGTAQVAQATARVAATSTAQAQATVQAHQALYTQATNGTPALNDALGSQSGSQWEEFTSTVNGTCGFSGGSYHAIMPKATFFRPCFATAATFSNFALQVKMTIQGDEGGIIFRADEVNDKFYLLSVSTDGTYNLYLYVNNQGSQAQTLLSGHSSSILPAGQSNEITLVAQGSQLSFYINKQYLNSLTDATYTTGTIGVFGESRTQPTDAAFSNIKIWTF